MNCTHCVNILSIASVKYLKEYTAKRARESEDQAIQAGSSAGVGLFKRARGCSSKFSTLRLSLEILSGVCSLRSLDRSYI